MRSGVTKAAGGITAIALGMNSVVQTNGAAVGTITSARVYDAKVSAFTSGTITSGYNFYGGGSSKSGAGVITSFANMALVDSTSATNNTNVLIGTATIPAGNYAIYSTDTDPSVLTGKLTVGSVDITDTGAKPTCDATTRGTFWVDEGGALVKDTVEVCAKDGADAYAWRTLY